MRKTTMDYTDLLNPQIPNLPVYQPGRPIELVAREFGLNPDKIIKLASNENPLGICPAGREAVEKGLKDAWMYPDNSGYFLVNRLAERHDLSFDQIALGAGSNEIFYMLCALFVRPGIEVVMGEYAFISYKIGTLLSGGTPVLVKMPDYKHDLNAMRAAITDKTRLVFLPNPNNPTGSLVGEAELLAFARSLPDQVIFCYDEAYAEYQESPANIAPLIAEGRKVIGTRTFSKIFGLAGLRIGYGYGDLELMKLLNSVRAPFNTSSIAQVAALAALEDTDWVIKSREVNAAGLTQLTDGFTKLGLDWVPSAGNFVLVNVPQANVVWNRLQQSGVIVRPVAGYGLPEHLRVSVGTFAQNEMCLKEMSRILADMGGL